MTGLQMKNVNEKQLQQNDFIYVKESSPFNWIFSVKMHVEEFFLYFTWETKTDSYCCQITDLNSMLLPTV